MAAVPKYGRNDEEIQEQPWQGWWAETGDCGSQEVCVIYTDL